MIEEPRITEEGEERLTEDGDQRVAAVPEQQPVTSVFGRTGAVVAQAGDYTVDMIPSLSDTINTLWQAINQKADADTVNAALAQKADAAAVNAALAGKADASHPHTLEDIFMLDAGGRSFRRVRAGQDEVAGNYTFVPADSGSEKVFVGSSPAVWTVPALAAGTMVVVHNDGSANLTFVANGVTLIGLTTLNVEKTAALTWLPSGKVKLLGELV